MKTSDLFRLSTDNLRRRKGRTLLTVIGVVVGTCAIVVMISLGIATNKSTEEMLASWSDLTQIQVFGYSVNTETPALDDKMVNTFKNTSHVVAATPFYNFSNMNANIVTGQDDRYSTSAWNVIGVDPAALEPMDYELVSGRYLSSSSRSHRQIPVLVGEDFAYNFEDTRKSYSNPKRYRYKDTDENGNALNDPFFDIAQAELKFQMITGYDDQGNPRTVDYQLEVVGMMKSDYAKTGSTGIIMNIEDMKYLEKEMKKQSGSGAASGSGAVVIGGEGNNTGGYSQVYVKVDEVSNVELVETAIQNIGYETFSMSQTRKDMQKQVAGSQMLLGGLAAISLLVAALNIANTMTMAIYERTKEIGVMKVLGCGLGKIRQMFLIESGAIGFIGGVIGVLVSLGLSYVLNHITAWLQALSGWLAQIGVYWDLSGFNMGGLLSGMTSGLGTGSTISIVPWWLVIVALAFATVVGLLSGIAPANRAVKISALEAIRHE